MTRIITLDEDAASLSEGALALIKAMKTFESEVLPKVSPELSARHDLASLAQQTKRCREGLESLREKLMVEAAGDVVLKRRRK